MNVTNDAYLDAYRFSLSDPNGFWAEAARAITWSKKPESILTQTADAPGYRWFDDGLLNTAYNALDRHVVGGNGDSTALIYDSPVSGSQKSYTYAELLERTRIAAGALLSLGVQPGDRVLIYCPMIPEAVIAMLSCARIGAVHVVVFGGFAAAELATRIDDAKPKVVIAASCGIEPNRVIEYKPILDEALTLAKHRPQSCVVLQRPQGPATLRAGDIDWHDLQAASVGADCVPVKSTDPLYILYTSGTTGRPKGLVRDNGGHAVALQWSMSNVFGIGPGDVMFTGSDIGWVVGHSYIVYGPLLAGAATVLYEGKPVGTPDAESFWRLISDHAVSAMFTAPTAIRAIRRDDPSAQLIKKHNLSSLRATFLAGERLDPDTYEWLSRSLQVPIIDNWWQTETGWPIASCLLGLAPMRTKPGSATVPVPGYDVRILDADGKTLPRGVEGAVCLKLPLPPGVSSHVYGDEDRFQRAYLSAFDGYYLTGDGGYIDDDGYLFILGRTDDVMNVAGHRLSSGQIEAVVGEHVGVAECAVVGARDPLKGQVPHALIVAAASHVDSSEQLSEELTALVRARIGGIASLSRVDVVPGLPKTRSGKIVRRTLRQIVDGDVPEMPSTIENPLVVPLIVDAVRTRYRGPG